MMRAQEGPIDAALHPILLLESDANDAFRIKSALRKAGIMRPIRVVFDPADAFCYLAGLGRFDDRDQHPAPSLFVMSAAIDSDEGLEVLRWIRQKSDVRGLPVIVLANAATDDDVMVAYELGANACVPKPLTAPALDSLVLTVELCRGMGNNWAVPAS